MNTNIGAGNDNVCDAVRFELKRLNFFTGLFTTAEDWIAEQQYHVEKGKLYHRYLHKPGVIEGLDVEVRQVSQAGIQLSVTKGAALDSCGNLIVLKSDYLLQPLVSDSENLGCFYITIEYGDSLACFEANVQDPEFSGHKYRVERPVVQLTKDPPTDPQIELARFCVDSAADAKPKLDFSHQKIAGVRDDRFETLQQRLLALYRHHQEQAKRHNRGLHTPGILRGVGDEMAVEPLECCGAYYVHVKPGAALDIKGNEIFLPTVTPSYALGQFKDKLVFVVARYTVDEDGFETYLEDLQRPHKNHWRTAHIELTTDEPDNKSVLELARIDLPTIRSPFTTEQINSMHKVWAGSIGLVSPRLQPELQTRICLLMQAKRKHFVELASRFPSPAITDARQAALCIQMSITSVEPNVFYHLMNVMADTEHEVEHALGKTYPPLVEKPEFKAYQDAVAALLDSLRCDQPIEAILQCEETVSEKAHSLSEIAFSRPVADAGPDQSIRTTGDVAKVTLDASRSKTGEGRKIVEYCWKVEE